MACLHNIIALIWTKQAKAFFLPYKVNCDVVTQETGVSSKFWIFLWTLLQLVKLLSTLEHHCCSRTKLMWRGGRGVEKALLPRVSEVQNIQCQIGLTNSWNASRKLRNEFQINLASKFRYPQFSRCSNIRNNWYKTLYSG